MNVISILDTLHTCSASTDERDVDDKNNSMNDIINLKAEAKKLLDDLNYKAGASNTNEYFFDEESFKERLVNLKQRIALLQSSISGHLVQK